jgi:peroxiredoxin
VPKNAIDLKRLVIFAVIALAVAGAWWAIGGGSGSGDEAAVAVASNPVRAAVLMEPPRAPGQEALPVGSKEGELAPDFEASDLQGNRFRLSDYRGKAVLLNFWASWCTSCAAEMPAIQESLDEHREHGFVVIAVNLGDRPETAQRYLEKRGVTFDVALDTELTIAREYRVNGLPVSYFIDRAGIIRRVWFGEMRPATIENFTHEILSGGLGTSTSEPAGGVQAAAALPVDGKAVLRLTLNIEGPGTLLLQSPSLRCGADFCAGYLLSDLRKAAGVLDANSKVIDWQTGEWGFLVRYDSNRINPERIVALYQVSLSEHPDPLYPAPHQVTTVEAKRR